MQLMSDCFAHVKSRHCEKTRYGLLLFLMPVVIEICASTPRGSDVGSVSTEVVIEPLEGVANERQTHLGRLLHLGAAALLDSLSLEDGGIIRLVDLVCGEVSGIDVGCEPGLERCSDASQAVEVDTTEEGVTLELMRTTPSETVLGVAHHAAVIRVSYKPTSCSQSRGALPSDQVLCLNTERDVIWEV